MSHSPLKSASDADEESTIPKSSGDYNESASPDDNVVENETSSCDSSTARQDDIDDDTWPPKSSGYYDRTPDSSICNTIDDIEDDTWPPKSSGHYDRTPESSNRHTIDDTEDNTWPPKSSGYYDKTPDSSAIDLWTLDKGKVQAVRTEGGDLKAIIQEADMGDRLLRDQEKYERRDTAAYGCDGRDQYNNPRQSAAHYHGNQQYDHAYDNSQYDDPRQHNAQRYGGQNYGTNGYDTYARPNNAQMHGNQGYGGYDNHTYARSNHQNYMPHNPIQYDSRRYNRRQQYDDQCYGAHDNRGYTPQNSHQAYGGRTNNPNRDANISSQRNYSNNSPRGNGQPYDNDYNGRYGGQDCSRAPYNNRNPSNRLPYHAFDDTQFGNAGYHNGPQGNPRHNRTQYTNKQRNNTPHNTYDAQHNHNRQYENGNHNRQYANGNHNRQYANGNHNNQPSHTHHRKGRSKNQSVHNYGDRGRDSEYTGHRGSVASDGNVVYVQTVQHCNQVFTQRELSRTSLVGFCTEHYTHSSGRELVSLVQVDGSEDDKTIVFDVLSCADLLTHVTTLKELRTHTAIVKVVHDSREHMHVLHDQYNLVMANVYDTQTTHIILQNIAYREDMNAVSMYWAGRANTILGSIQHTPTTWRRRPLPRQLVDCAAQNVQSAVAVYNAQHAHALKTPGMWRKCKKSHTTVAATHPGDGGGVLSAKDMRDKQEREAREAEHAVQMDRVNKDAQVVADMFFAMLQDADDDTRLLYQDLKVC
ncbi:hypothetical protein SARC_01320 [Sphaeroforma arctica JP610]|uniref:3'-5' exonuclease domain-containing protein n=1 Tax=Sphaeroforma arctica JP610 TaxID=667725 RepID=A0A0L0GC09_9EUKA|nr:hypothetical protein SARC_01320 [Sphaeroforma arctica JP610]KNC86547.1 hypothetical protein SARC_01320 [Sphaeroforma arctica JP610]|eukprot:XP_014160449.1 hypothetical protein SARC_01320 [Sphaeroforma arctica JP610]